MIERRMNQGLPPKEGLYDPENEHDACGVGFVVDIQGRQSHAIVRRGLEILVNLTHRGATGCDPLTGDGAGIITQIPHEFFKAKAAELGYSLPEPGDYGIGFVFLPNDADQRQWCVDLFEKLLGEEGLELIGWRDVPVDNEHIGWSARDVEPVMKQVFIKRGPNVAADMLEWKLYVARKRLEVAVYDSDLSQKKYCYLPSLSTKTIIYKGLMLAEQVERFYLDLADERFVSALALVHQRYSTNTFPTWDLAHPFRYLAHNGEINTVRGNVNWMRARQSLLAHEKYGADIQKIFPIYTTGGSDSANFDNVLELLVKTGRSLPEAMSMMVPEPWAGHETMSDEKKAYYEFKACLMEPWDGPASMAFTDGTIMGGTLDRNGLRPCRYWVTKNDWVIMASEAGVLEFPPEEIVEKGRLRPGRMFIVDTAQKRILTDDEVKNSLASRHPYRRWLNENQIKLDDLPKVAEKNGVAKNGAATNGHAANGASSNGHGDLIDGFNAEQLLAEQRAFGYTLEDLKVLMAPMAADGMEALGSMGTDTPIAVLSNRPQLIYNYFKQLFAQVTNPPLDAIREEIVTMLITTIGCEGNLLAETPSQAKLLRLDSPVLTNEQLERIRALDKPAFKSRTFKTLFAVADGAEGMRRRLKELQTEVSQAIAEGVTFVILSDRGVDKDNAPIPALLAVSAMHHHLIREKTRTRCGLIVETGDAREVHHFCLLSAYGAGAINPYLAFDTLRRMQRDKQLPADAPIEKLEKNYIKAVGKGLLKVASKMGISTLQSYRGAQIFEAIGLNKEFIDEYFTRTSSRIQGVGLETIAEETLKMHEHAFPRTKVPEVLDLDIGGQYAWRRKGEAHLFNPETIAKLQLASRINSKDEFKRFCDLIDNQERQYLTLRGLMEFKPGSAIPLEEVEPAKEIVKRFATGAMSYGSISKEAHETLAVAMNAIGGKSNTGEGGEDPIRYLPPVDGKNLNSAIKQVASGRFGVTSLYLVNAKELQIKMAQGAKPGEGGQLPGHKIDKEIGRIRHSTPGVGLISPPPHHDIYSIEDLAQLIHDLKNANHHARISVKLVAEVGVGTVAAGVAKGKSDVVLISGYDGGTGASPLTSIKHAGIPWELGLAETHQVLVKNDLRGRIVVQTDGQLRTPRDIAIATMLGAEEWGIATASLVTIGCIMMRKCHLNTCPVGIATQDPSLRAKFSGSPEHVINYFFMVAEGLREIMASLGFRTVNEMVGRVDMLDAKKAINHWKAKGLDFSEVLFKPNVPPHIKTFCSESQDHGIERSLDITTLVPGCEPALKHGKPVTLNLPIKNVNRTVGTILSSEVTRHHGAKGLPEDTIQLNFTGTAGQSIGAFGAPGVTIRVEGDVNDYCGKGLSGGKIIVFPPKVSSFASEKNIIAGNVVLYGATAGEIYLRGIVGERFCVRNSGAKAVVEGVGDHGCEYMTGGIAVVLGETGRNFAAGMSGGIAYVYDEKGTFKTLVNKEMVEFDPLLESDEKELQRLIRRHVEYTGSVRGESILKNWEQAKLKFVKVMPVDYKRALAEQQKEKEAASGKPAAQLAEVSRG